MADKKREPKERASNYEEKVKFEGTFEQMLQIAIKPKPKQSKNNEASK